MPTPCALHGGIGNINSRFGDGAVQSHNMQSDHLPAPAVACQPALGAPRPGWLLPLVLTLLPPLVLVLLFRTAMLPLLGPGVLLIPALPIFPVGAGIILGWRTGKTLPGKVLQAVAWTLGCAGVSGSLLKLGLYPLPI